jgi:transketolase
MHFLELTNGIRNKKFDESMKNLEKFAQQIRILSLQLCYLKKTSHIGGAFSVADILAVLYGSVLNISNDTVDDNNRDRLFYSKGHSCTSLYSALQIKGFFKDINLINDFLKNGSYFTSHVNHKIPGIELSTGSLGHALGIACGSALASIKKRISYDVFAILSDGELDEGSNWEAILFAAHNHLENLILVIDYNKIQSFGRIEDVMALEPLAKKLESFNWDVTEVNGHDIFRLRELLHFKKKQKIGKPKCIIAHTIKGKGVGFMENKLLWHYKSPNESEYQLAIKELSNNYA